jgi:hypothetical protein
MAMRNMVWDIHSRIPVAEPELPGLGLDRAAPG